MPCSDEHADAAPDAPCALLLGAALLLSHLYEIVCVASAFVGAAEGLGFRV